MFFFFFLVEQAKPEDFQYLTRIQYQDIGDGIWGEHEIDYVLFLYKDVDLKPNPSEVSEIRYLSRENIDKYLLNKKKININNCSCIMNVFLLFIFKVK